MQSEPQMSLQTSGRTASRAGDETCFLCIAKKVNSLARQFGGLNIKVDSSFLREGLQYYELLRYIQVQHLSTH